MCVCDVMFLSASDRFTITSASHQSEFDTDFFFFFEMLRFVEELEEELEVLL